MTNLHAELARIADAAPAVHVPDDVWEQGRRARTRDRVLGAGAAVVAVAAVLALVVGLGGLLRPGAAPVPPADDGPGAPGLPTRIWSVPEGLVEHPDGPEQMPRWSAAVAETDLAVGRAAVAFSSGSIDEHPVVVTADDGRYHLLDLPGWLGAGMLNATTAQGNLLALSPDGRSLAYGWWDPEAPLDRPMPAGVRIVDLGSGRVRTIALHGGNGVRVSSLVWSPDSRWVAWSGDETRSWTPHSSAAGRPVSGIIGPRGTRSRPVDVDQVLAVLDGRAVLTRDRGRLRWDGLRVTEEASRLGWSRAALAPDGRWVVLEMPRPEPSLAVLSRRDRLGPALLHRPALDPEDHPEGALSRPLGWVDADHAVVLLTPAYDVEVDSGWSSTEHELALLDLGSGAVTVVGEVAMESAGSFTVATELMTLERPTVDRPRPDFPGVDDPERAWLLAAGGAVVLGAALAAYVVGRRRRAVMPG